MNFREYITESNAIMLIKKYMDDKKNAIVTPAAKMASEVMNIYIPNNLYPKKYKNKTKYTNIIPDERGLFYIWGNIENIVKEFNETFKLSDKEILKIVGNKK